MLGLSTTKQAISALRSVKRVNFDGVGGAVIQLEVKLYDAVAVRVFNRAVGILVAVAVVVRRIGIIRYEVIDICRDDDQNQCEQSMV